MGKKSDKKDKKLKSEKKHGKNGGFVKVREAIVKFFVKYGQDGVINTDIISRYNQSFNALTCRADKYGLNYTVTAGISAVEPLLFMAVSLSAKDLDPESVAALDMERPYKAIYDSEAERVECSMTVFLPKDAMTEKYLKWAVNRLVTECEYTAFCCRRRSAYSCQEEPYDEEDLLLPPEESDSEEAGEEVGFLERFLKAAGSLQEKAEPEAPSGKPAEQSGGNPAETGERKTDGTLSDAEYSDCSGLLWQLINNSLSHNPAEKTAGQTPAEKGKPDGTTPPDSGK